MLSARVRSGIFKGTSAGMLSARVSSARVFSGVVTVFQEEEMKSL